MTVASSLFDPPASAVLPAASDWITAALLGTLAVTLCVVAVALVGFMMLTGHVAVREGLRVVIGCFVLLAAPPIALGLQRSAADSAQPAGPQALGIAVTSSHPQLQPSDYDPYAGASLRTDTTLDRPVRRNRRF